MRRSGRRLFLVLFTSLILAVGLLAGLEELQAQEKSFLWKAQSDKDTVYILGSIHLLKKDSSALTPVIEDIFSKTKRLVLEIDLLNESAEKLQQLILQKGIILDGKTLDQKVSKETYELVAKSADELGIDIKLLSPLKPWVVALTMVVMQLQKLGYDPNLGIDHQLARRAKQEKKPVEGLESAEYQVDIFDRLTPGEQEMMLRQSLEEMRQVEKSVDEIVRSWRKGDVAAAETLFLESMRAYPQLQEKILDERNRRWLPQIEKFLKQGGETLVVVGAAHLVGKNGVIELLRRRGYTLEQM